VIFPRHAMSGIVLRLRMIAWRFLSWSPVRCDP